MTFVRVLQYLVALNALVLIAQSVRVIAAYGAVYSMTTGPARHLPMHVWLVATSYLVFLISTTYFLLAGGGNYELTRTVMYGIAGAFGQYGLWNILSYEKRKLTQATGYRERTGQAPVVPGREQEARVDPERL